MLDARARNRGFTLLEALVALSILAGSSTALVSLVAVSARAQAAAEADASAAILVETLLARLGRDMPIETGTQSGISPDGLRWILQINAFEPDTRAERAGVRTLFFVKVQARQEKPARSIVEATTLKRGSKW